MQNVILLMESSANLPDLSTKAGNMCLNRLCIDENEAFELSGVFYINQPPTKRIQVLQLIPLLCFLKENVFFSSDTWYTTELINFMVRLK